MKFKLLTAILVIGGLTAGSARTYAAEDHASDQHIALSPELVELLRAEMREISKGIQSLALSLATADWHAIQETSEKIRASYIMENQLTPAQAEELEHVLPEQFKQLDADFHHRAQKLGLAAAEHDAELALFHYSRLLESCANCHSTYAKERFPEFASPIAPSHQH